MNVVIVVELFARWGILRRPLLIIIKNSLAIKAKPAPRIKCQSRISFKIPMGVKFDPLINDRDPVNKIEITVTSENKIVYKITCNIFFVFWFIFSCFCLFRTKFNLKFVNLILFCIKRWIEFVRVFWSLFLKKDVAWKIKSCKL